MSWDQSKENIQPLRQGRKVEALFHLGDSQSMNSQIKQAHLDKISSALQHEDPLEPYVEYISWYRKVNSNLGSEYYKILHSCVCFFRDNNLIKKYDRDIRFVRVWLSYAEQFADPQSIYEYMRSHGIGTSLATFYEWWSRSLETKGNYSEAKVILCEGVSQLAQPTTRLERLLVELQDRIDKNILETPDPQFYRNVLGNLTSHKGKIDSIRASSYQKSAQPIGALHKSSNRQTEEFSVYRGPADNVTQPPAYPNTALPTRERLSQENTQPYSKWIKASVPITSDCRQAPPVDFIIHPDPEVPLSVPALTDIPKRTLKVRVQIPEPDPLHVLEERPSARCPEFHEVLMYPYWEVYPYGSVEDITVEELRAKRYMKQQEIDGEDMEFTCMDRATVKLSPNWSIPDYKQTYAPVQRTGANVTKLSPLPPPQQSFGGYERAIVTRTLSGSDHYLKEPNTFTPSAVTRRNIGPVVHTPVESYRIPESQPSPQIYSSKYLSGHPSLSRSRSFDENLVNVSSNKMQGSCVARSPYISQSSQESILSKDNSSNSNPLAYTAEIKSSPIPVSDKYTPYSIPPPSRQDMPANREVPDTIEDTSMSRRADAVILNLFATTLPSEKEEIVNHIETVKIKADINLHIFEPENKHSDISLMPAPSRTITYRTPAKNSSLKFPDTSIDSSLIVQRPTSTPMGARIVPLSLEDVTQIPSQDTMSHLDPVALRFGQLNCDENKENAVSVTSSALVEQKVERERSTRYLSPIDEASQENSSGKSSMEEAVTLIYPFDLLTIRKMINEYKSQNSYSRLIDCTSSPVPNIGVKRTCQFGNVHFKILERIGIGGFANVYLASPLTPEAQKLTLTERPVLKVVMKQPSCIEYLIGVKIQEKLTELKQTNLCSSFYQPYSCLVYKNATIIVSDYYPYGTLLDMINELKVRGGIDEFDIIQFALEVLYLVETLHSIGIVHNDIKPDNFMLRSKGPITTNRRDPEGTLLHLIDFGRSVDLSLFPKNVQFLGSSETDTFELPCMKTTKPYLYNCDSFSVAATLYCLITYEYPRIISEPDGCKVKLVCPIKSSRRNYLSVWDSLIYKLMNASSYEAMAAIAEGRKEIKELYHDITDFPAKWD